MARGTQTKKNTGIYKKTGNTRTRGGKRYTMSTGTKFKSRTSGAIQKFTKRSTRSETKTLDTTFAAAYVTPYVPDLLLPTMLPTGNSNVNIQILNPIQQGAGISQRIGHKVSLKSVKLQMNFEPVGSVVMGNIQHVRVMLVYDHDCNGAYPAINLILANSGQANQIANGTYFDNLNPNFFERMVVLMDRKYTLPQIGTVGGQITAETTFATNAETFIIDEFVNLKSLECIYGNQNGASTASPLTVAYIQTGALYLLVYGDVANTATAWALTGTTRLRFDDN